MALGKDYPKFQAKITECMDILAQNLSLDTSDKDNSLINLVSSGFSAIMTLVDKQQNLIQRMMPLILIRDRDGAELQADYDLKVQDRDTARQ